MYLFINIITFDIKCSFHSVINHRTVESLLKFLSSAGIRYRESYVTQSTRGFANNPSHEVPCEFENNARNYFLNAIDTFLLRCVHSKQVRLFDETLKDTEESIHSQGGPWRGIRDQSLLHIVVYVYVRNYVHCSFVMTLLSSPLLDFLNYLFSM